MSLNFFQSVDDLISHQSQVLTAIIGFLLHIVLKDLQISVAIFSNFEFAKFSLKKSFFDCKNFFRRVFTIRQISGSLLLAVPDFVNCRTI